MHRSQLLCEQWFHASISRQAAEALLKQDGDFLVRESQGKPGQYVLTGLQGQTPKHLLLIDPEGTVSDYSNSNYIQFNSICFEIWFNLAFLWIRFFRYAQRIASLTALAI